MGNRSWRNSSAVDLVNPLEPELNVSYNVNTRAVEMFQRKCKEDASKMEILHQAELEGTSGSEGGLFWLLDGPKVNNNRKNKVLLVVPRIAEILKKEDKLEIEELFKISSNPPARAAGGKPVSRMDQSVQKKEKTPKPESGSLKISVENLFPKQEKKKNQQNDSSSDTIEEDRVKNLKAKYLRSQEQTPFNYKL